MPKSGYLFIFLTCVGVFGTAGIMIMEIVRGETVSAESLPTPIALYGFPVTMHAPIPPRDARTVFAETVTEEKKEALSPVIRESASPAPKLSAKSALVIDAATGARLFEKNSDAGVSIASITKLLTALTIVDEAPRWVATSTVINATEEGRNFLMKGDVVTLRDLLFTSLVGSSNSATSELVKTITPPGASFPAKMRLKAGELGLSTVAIDDPAGLSAKNKASAADVATMLGLALKRPIIREALGSEAYDVTTSAGTVRRVTSTNWLFSQDGNKDLPRIIGGKTGYLPEAGFNFAVSFVDAAGHEIHVVVLGAEDHYARFTEAEKLAQWVLSNFTWQ